VRSTSIGMPGGSAHEEVCIAAGVAAEGGCEWRKENRVCRGAEEGEQSVQGSGGRRTECTGELSVSSARVQGHLEARWKTSFPRRLRSRCQAALNQPLKSVSLGLSVPDSAILSWVVRFNPQQNLSTIVMGLV
jgi:hypothetical protein